MSVEISAAWAMGFGNTKTATIATSARTTTKFTSVGDHIRDSSRAGSKIICFGTAK